MFLQMDDKASATYNVLERMLCDESEEPQKLLLSLLQAITNNFSDELKIDSGGFAVVYKGMLQTGTVAVKLLSQRADMDEDKFSKEVQNLMKVRHKNIVRFMGYCADTQGEMTDYEGKPIMADVRNRALCFEFVPNGNLHDYINDANRRLEWSVCYQMIKGICQGLHYLHEMHILHLDLKPANILVDDNMVPKIADFGLSRHFDENQTKAITMNLFGTIGYFAPEFHNGQITYKSDIYSLGVIILEMLTGKKWHGNSTVDKVLESWRDRMEMSQGDIPLQQVTACAEIGIMCIDSNPANRPTIHRIIKTFEELGGTEELIEAGISGSYGSKFLRVQPLHLRFPLESKKLMISCLLHLTNVTDDYVAFRLLTKSPKKNFKGPLCGIVPPRSRYTLVVTMCSQLKLPSGSKEFFTLETSIDVYRGLQDNDQWDEKSSYGVVTDYNRLDRHFTLAKERGHYYVHKVKLTAAYMSPGVGKTTSKPKIMIWPLQDVNSIDVHPMEPWILTGHSNGFVHIQNYHTQEIVNSFEVSKGSRVEAVKFIARKEWLVAGDKDGYMHVYDYDKNLIAKNKMETTGQGPVSFAIHPTEPYVLSMRKRYIQLWDWENCKWHCYRVDYFLTTFDAKFNPDPDVTISFACAYEDATVKVYDVDASGLHMRRLYDVNQFRPLCLDYVTLDDELYLITGCMDRTAKIWNYQTGSCLQTLKGHTEGVTSVCCLPGLQILVTGSKDGTLRLWNSTTFKVQGVIDCGLGTVRHIYYLKDSRRIAIRYDGGLAITEIDH